MKNSIYIAPYNRGSKSANALRQALGTSNILSVIEKNPRLVERNNSPVHIINWGRTKLPDVLNLDNDFYILNDPDAVKVVSNKLNFFKKGEDIETLKDMLPPHWENKDDIPDNSYPIVCRTVLNGHSGEGIVIANSKEELVDAPLYTKYIKKTDEFRVHMVFDPIGSYVYKVQQKKRNLDVPDDDVNWQVRNHQNGFIYASPTSELPDDLIDTLSEIISELDLHFCAFDIIYNRHQNKFYLLEVNTAAGIEGSTLDFYVEAFQDIVEHS